MAEVEREQEQATEKPAKPRRIDWNCTERTRRQFLDRLAETFDFEAACAAARINLMQLRKLIERCPEFLSAIEDVVALGYVRLDVMLLRSSGIAGGKVDPALARELLKMRRAMKAERRTPARGPRAGPAAKRPAESREELIAKLVNKMAPLQAAQERGGTADGRQGAGKGAGVAASGAAPI